MHSRPTEGYTSHAHRPNYWHRKRLTCSAGCRLRLPLDTRCGSPPVVAGGVEAGRLGEAGGSLPLAGKQGSSSTMGRVAFNRLKAEGSILSQPMATTAGGKQLAGPCKPHLDIHDAGAVVGTSQVLQLKQCAPVCVLRYTICTNNEGKDGLVSRWISCAVCCTTASLPAASSHRLLLSSSPALQTSAPTNPPTCPQAQMPSCPLTVFGDDAQQRRVAHGERQRGKDAGPSCCHLSPQRFCCRLLILQPVRCTAGGQRPTGHRAARRPQPRQLRQAVCKGCCHCGAAW